MPTLQGWRNGSNGLRYAVHSGTGDTLRPQPGMVCLVDIRYGTPDTLFLDTWKQGRPVPINMRSPQYPGDLFEGMSLVHRGDSVTFRLLADSFFMRTTGMGMLPPAVSPGDSVDILMVIREVMTEREHRIKVARDIHQELKTDRENDTVQ